MLDRFDLSREQPHKEWWRERRIAPATFFGFPDVTKVGLRGGSLYVEQMDAVTLAVLADKCVKENVWDPEIWMKFSFRAQQLSTYTHEPDLCYIFRAFARADWFDQNLLTTYLGRLHRRLHMFQLPDVAVLLEAFSNPRFRQGNYLEKALTHMALLLQHRDDAKAEELARTCVALRDLRPQPAEVAIEVQAGLELLAEALLLRELSELSPAEAVNVLDSFVLWGMVSRERREKSSAAIDLCWALARELLGKIRELGREKPEDLATLAWALSAGGIEHENIWNELAINIELEAYRMPGPAAARAAHAAAKAGHRGYKLYENLARRLGEEAPKLSAMDCAHAASGFLRGPGNIAEKVVLRGPVGERIFLIGFGSFDAEALTVLLDAFSRARPSVWGVEAMAGALLEELHPRLTELSFNQLASTGRSLGYLQPEAPDVLQDVLDRAIEALEARAAEREGQSVPPRYVAMLCHGIAAQPPRLLPDAAQRLQALLPKIDSALDANSTALSVVQILASLARCSPCEERSTVLDKCAQFLSSKAYELPAPSLVLLATSAADVARSGWTVPHALSKAVGQRLDIKRYDLAPGTLWRAVEAMQALGAPADCIPELEPRDHPSAAKKPRRKGSMHREQAAAAA